MTDAGAPNDSLRILCVGDLHIGREPALREEVLEAAGLKPRALSVVPAWEEAQRVAIEERVAAVLLAGDVVDSDDGFLAAYGPLSQGVRQWSTRRSPCSRCPATTTRGSSRASPTRSPSFVSSAGTGDGSRR